LRSFFITYLIIRIPQISIQALFQGILHTGYEDWN
jgi:hypothetical protein